MKAIFSSSLVKFKEESQSSSEAEGARCQTLIKRHWFSNEENPVEL